MSENIYASAIVLLAFIAIGFILIQVVNFFSLRKRRAYFTNLQESLKPGVTVVINSSFIVKVKKVYDEECLVELAPGVEIKVTRYSINEIIKEG